MHIEVKNLHKSFGAFSAIKDVSFGIEKGRLIGLLGPSGGGKTTILRMLAGLESPCSGAIHFHGRLVNELPPQQRGIGFVFQNYALFKHMTVFDNIAFGLKVNKKSGEQVSCRVNKLLELTELKGLEKRYPNELSGGQRQRVAFARALAPEPELLLLDEPFAAIDAKIRQELRTWLREMITRVGITSIFVTHDQEEAIEVADEIIIINNGILEQKGTPWDIYKTPATPFVAHFIGESNHVENPSRFKGFATLAPNGSSPYGIIRPEYIELRSLNTEYLAHAGEKGQIKHVHFRGDSWYVEVDVKGSTLVTYRPVEEPILTTGDDVNVLIHRMYIFDGAASYMQENAGKADPMPVFI